MISSILISKNYLLKVLYINIPFIIILLPTLRSVSSLYARIIEFVFVCFLFFLILNKKIIFSNFFKEIIFLFLLVLFGNYLSLLLVQLISKNLDFSSILIPLKTFIILGSILAGANLILFIPKKNDSRKFFLQNYKKKLNKIIKFSFLSILLIGFFEHNSGIFYDLIRLLYSDGNPYYGRVSAAFINPIHLGIFSVIYFNFFIFQLKEKIDIKSFLCLFGTLYLIYISGSRIGVLGVLISLNLFLLFNFKRTYFFLVFLGVIIFFFSKEQIINILSDITIIKKNRVFNFIFLLNEIEYKSLYNVLKSNLFNTRFVLWKQGLNGFFNQPFIGHGVKQNIHFESYHLTYMYSYGILNFFLFSFLFYRLIYLLTWVRKKIKVNELLNDINAMIITLISLFICGMITQPFDIFKLIIFLFFIYGYILSMGIRWISFIENN